MISGSDFYDFLVRNTDFENKLYQNFENNKVRNVFKEQESWIDKKIKAL